MEEKPSLLEKTISASIPAIPAALSLGAAVGSCLIANYSDNAGEKIIFGIITLPLVYVYSKCAIASYNLLRK